MTIILLILTLVAVLFILYKVVTSTTIPNLNININNKNRSPYIRDSFNNTTNIDNSTHNTINFSDNSYNDSSNIILYLLGLFITGVIATNFYKKNIDKINSVLIFSILIVAVIYLCVVLYSKLKGFLSKELIVYLILSFWALFIVIYFFFYPQYTPANISTLKPYTATFIILRLIGSFGQIIITLVSLVQILKNYSLDQIKTSFIVMTIISIICFMSTSGIALHLITTLYNFS